MKLFFRQGLVRYQTDISAHPAFLQRSSNSSQFVDLIVSPDPTVIAFAHKNADYVYEEAKTVLNAWGPFTGSATCYLYWDINVLTAELTRSYTLLPPIYSGASPNSPATDQHWFDTIESQMRVWTGLKWVDKIRCFAGILSSSAVLKPFAAGSQAGMTLETQAGNIILDTFNKPLRNSDGSFVTSKDSLSVVGIATKKIKFEAEILNLLAMENIPKFSLVQVRPGRKAVLAHSSDRNSRVSGLASEDLFEGEVGTIISAGLIRSDTWTWDNTAVNKPLFCGIGGELTTTPATAGVLQQVGFVYDTDAVYINLFPPIVIDHPDSINLPPPPPNPLAPVANFSVSPLLLTGTAPFIVNFVNASTNSPTSLEWDFTNDGVVDSTLNAPTYTYATPGVYTVRLRAINSYGSDEEVKVGYITVNAPPATGTFTNLDITFKINNIADTSYIVLKRNEEFEVKVTVHNDGFLTATNVVRTVNVFDVAGVHQVVPSSLPPGTVVTRVGQYTKIVLPTIASMISGSTVVSAFHLTVPPVAKPINMEGSVVSPEIDAETGDNTRSLTIQVIA